MYIHTYIYTHICISTLLPNSHSHQVDMLRSLMDLVGVGKTARKLAASAASLRARAVLSKVYSALCLASSFDSLLRHSRS